MATGYTNDESTFFYDFLVIVHSVTDALEWSSFIHILNQICISGWIIVKVDDFLCSDFDANFVEKQSLK